MKRKGGNLYVVFSGHICTGKDTIIDALKERGILQEIVGPGAGVHILTEAVNHDQDVLGSYYGNMADTTEFFELGTLCFRSVLGSSIERKNGIVISNRHVIEARQTFVEHSRTLKKDKQKFFDETATGVYDMLLRRGMEKGVIPIPDVVFFLFVDDTEILVERNKKRGDVGEKTLTANYIRSVASYFDRYRKKFSDIYKLWGLKPPRLIEINVSKSFLDNPDFLNQVAEQCEEEMRKAYGERKRNLFDYDESRE